MKTAQNKCSRGVCVQRSRISVFSDKTLSLFFVEVTALTEVTVMTVSYCQGRAHLSI